MTRPALPPVVSFAELLHHAVEAATVRLVQGSQRNAQDALDVHDALARETAEALAAVATLPVPRSRTG